MTLIKIIINKKNSNRKTNSNSNNNKINNNQIRTRTKINNKKILVIWIQMIVMVNKKMTLKKTQKTMTKMIMRKINN